jgi:hypothetical protein
MADTFKVERSALINAPAEVVFGYINDLHEWAKWSPWENVPGDDLAKTFSGAQSGLGAVYAWTGKKTGQGRMEITESTPVSRIAIDLQFLKPFKQRNDTVFVLEPAGAGVNVTWTMSGKHNLMSKVMGLFMSMDKMVGGSFAQGLAKLKETSEATA